MAKFGEWIPIKRNVAGRIISELPEYGEKVLICDKTRNYVDAACFSYYESDNGTEIWLDNGVTDNVSAWMPLPDPY